LLAIFLFNWAGYQLFTSYVEAKKNTELETQLDNNRYDENQLVTIKIPVTSLPYYNNSKSFERTDGQIEIAGIPYKYVKRRIYNDSLELLCIPNKTAMQLHSAKDDFFKLVNDLQGQTKKTSSHSNNYKNFSLDNYTVNDFYQFNIDRLTLSKNHFHYSEKISIDFSTTDERPPDTFA
jgi:hypothetical protein